MAIKEDYAKAVELAKAGRLQEAKALLEPYKEDSRVQKLYQRLSDNNPATPAKSTSKPSRFRTIGIPLIALIVGLLLGYFIGQGVECNP